MEWLNNKMKQKQNKNGMIKFNILHNDLHNIKV